MAKTVPALKKITYKQCQEIAEARDQFVKDANPATKDIKKHLEALQAWTAYCEPFEEIGFTDNDFRRISGNVSLTPPHKATSHVARPADVSFIQLCPAIIAILTTSKVCRIHKTSSSHTCVR